MAKGIGNRARKNDDTPKSMDKIEEDSSRSLFLKEKEDLDKIEEIEVIGVNGKAKHEFLALRSILPRIQAAYIFYFSASAIISKQ